jgi:hypothetical protein
MGLKNIIRGCRHCGYPNVNRPKGLCWSCYYTPGIRELYPSSGPVVRGQDSVAGDYSRRGAGLKNALGKEPAPTRARPGTPEKMAVLQGRVERQEFLFHQADAQVALD